MAKKRETAEELPAEELPAEGEVTAEATDDDSPAKPELVVPGRDRLAADIGERLAEVRRKELGLDDEPETESEDAALEAQTEDQESASPEPETHQDGDKGEAQVVTVNIDGETKQVPIDTLIRNYQLGQAAESRLNAASQVLAQVEELRNKLALGEIDVTAKDNDGARKDDPLADIDFEATARAMMYESPEDAAKALRDLVSQVSSRVAPQQEIDPSQVTAQVMDRVNFDSAVQWFREEYTDILNDPYLAQRTAMRADEIYQRSAEEYRTAGKSMPSYRDMLTVAGNETREWLSSLVGGKAGDSDSRGNSSGNTHQDTKAPSTMSDRIERKRSQSQLPTSQGRGSPTAQRRPTDEQPKSEVERSREGIAQILKARGKVA